MTKGPSTVLRTIVNTIFVLGSALFFGGGIVRMALAYDVFIPGTLDAKPWYDQSSIDQTIRLFAVTGFYTLFAGAVAYLGGALSLALNRGRIKQRGWMAIAAILCGLALPFEGWLAWQDIRLVMTWQELMTTNMPVSNELREMFFRRMANPNSAFSYVTFLAYLSSFIFVVTKPLDLEAKPVR